MSPEKLNSRFRRFAIKNLEVRYGFVGSKVESTQQARDDDDFSGEFLVCPDVTEDIGESKPRLEEDVTGEDDGSGMCSTPHGQLIDVRSEEEDTNVVFETCVEVVKHVFGFVGPRDGYLIAFPSFRSEQIWASDT